MTVLLALAVVSTDFAIFGCMACGSRCLPDFRR